MQICVKPYNINTYMATITINEELTTDNVESLFDCFDKRFGYESTGTDNKYYIVPKKKPYPFKLFGKTLFYFGKKEDISQKISAQLQDAYDICFPKIVSKTEYIK